MLNSDFYFFFPAVFVSSWWLLLQISMEFRNLSKVYQDVISDICHKMGIGMAEFLEKKVDSQREWDKVSQPGHTQHQLESYLAPTLTDMAEDISGKVFGCGKADVARRTCRKHTMNCLLSIIFVKRAVRSGQLFVTIPFILFFFCPFPSRCLPVLSLRSWAGGDRPFPSLLCIRARRSDCRAGHGAGKLHGPLPAENQHHP